MLAKGKHLSGEDEVWVSSSCYLCENDLPLILLLFSNFIVLVMRSIFLEVSLHMHGLFLAAVFPSTAKYMTLEQNYI